jgi:hypothetical protein
MRMVRRRPDNTVARAAFHHMLWKESMGGLFKKYALLPPNLSLLNDIRVRTNAKKAEKQIETTGKNTGGVHDQLGLKALSTSQSIFTDIDPEAVYHVMQGP